MKLLNHTLIYVSLSLLIIISVWAGIFYFNMMDEINDSIDDGLENTKILVIQQVSTDSTLLHKASFQESNYAIREIHPSLAISYKDVYQDTMMYMLNEEDQEPVRILHSVFKHSNGKYYELRVISSMVEEDDLIEDLVYSLVWLYVAVIVSVVLVNNFVLKRVWRPFYGLLEQLKKFRLGKDEKIHTEKTSVKEFSDLNQAIDELIEKNILAFNHQKQFIENVAHELQTPVSVSINKLELLAEKQNLDEEQLQAIGVVIQSLDRLTRLNRSLLLLAKIENHQFTSSAEVHWEGVIKKCVEDFEDHIAYKEIDLQLTIEASPVSAMNAELAHIMLSNLLKNAILHNHSKGNISIHLTHDAITIENSGVSEALDPGKIFERFHSGGNSKQSTGLGLSIVKAIADLYGFKVSYEFNGRHVVKITF